MEVILKFFANETPCSTNEVVSRTMGKICIVTNRRRQDGAMPQDGEFWRCRVLKELRAGQRRGCFFVAPLSQVGQDDLLYLLPGMYDTTVKNGLLIVTPKQDYRGKHCILPLDHTHEFAHRRDVYAILVDVSVYAVPPVAEKQAPISRPLMMPGNPYVRS